MSKPLPRTKIHDLIYAKPCLRPHTIPLSRSRGVRAVGLRYERLVARAISRQFPRETTHGQWFEYCDARGPGYCQPDILISWLDGSGHIIIECKLTDVDAARDKLRNIYVPIVERALGGTVHAIVVTRHLTKETNKKLICDNLGAAVMRANGSIPTLHWLGGAEI